MSDARGAKRARTTAADKGKSAAPTRQSVAALLARLDRSALETLLADAVTDGAAPSVAALEEALPARLRAPTPLANGAGADVEALVTTGPFAALSADETLAIFALLPLKDKLTVLTAVCKGWCKLRSRPETWRALHVPAQPWLSPAGLMRILELAPPACAALDVSLDASRERGFGVEDVRRFVGALTAVTKLHLHEKVNAKCMEAIAKKHGARLRSLSLEMCVSDMKMLKAVYAMVAALPALESLELSSGVLGAYIFARGPPGVVALALGITPDVLDFMKAGIARARNGGGSLLTSLRAPITAAALPRLGAVFPELDTLHLPALMLNGGLGRSSFNDYPAITSEDEAEGNAATAAALHAVGDTAPLPRLARLAMSFTAERRYNPSPGSVAAVLAAFLPAVPAGTLRQLALRSNVKTPADVACPLSLLAHGAAAGLHTLLLQGFTIADGDLGQLRELRSLTLDGCSGSVVREACAAVGRCPRLRTLRLANMALTATDLKALPARQLTSLTLVRCGADAPAALLAAARSGALDAVATLTLRCPALDPLPVDIAAPGGLYRMLRHDTDLKGLFGPNAPLPALTALALGGVDLSAAEWGRLSAPALRAVELLAGHSTNMPGRSGFKRSPEEWEAERAAAAAALARACPRASVVVMDELRLQRSRYRLEGPHGDTAFYA